MPEHAFDLFLLAVGLCGATWAMTPAVMGLAGLSGLRYVAIEDPRLAPSQPDDTDYECKYQQLLALGFEPLGRLEERTWFQGFEWWKTFTLRALATRDRKCFATLHQLHPDEPWRVSLTTLTTGGGLIRTTTPGADIRDMQDNYLRIELQPGIAMADLQSQHREHVELFTQQQGVTVVAASLADYAAVDEMHDCRLLKGIWTTNAQMLPAQVFLAPCLIAWFTAQMQGLRGVSLALCAGLVVYALFRLGVAFAFRQQVLKDNPPAPAA